ncbi:TonB-dependent receptor [Aliidiomarina celeris]|uniref:TonB-dependent receptor n=1 Tax=Aliidiomarina celeris TaxID=2249428 RepID=UPI0018E5D56E|nr:TonB-dependent receptor [Aliidiomarina celeris]
MKSKLFLVVLPLVCAHTYTHASSVNENNTDSDSEPMERIVVRGDFRARGIETLPASVSVLSENDIQQRNAEHLEHILAMAANVNLSSGASRANFIQIRGVGERSQFVDPINPSVGLVLDGINYSALGAAATLFDIGQVEVFRGPQSTRFGADGMAGVVYLTSTPLSDFTDGVVEIDWANYNSYGAGFTMTQRFSDQVAVRGSLYRYESDGFIENTFLNRSDTNRQDELSLRLNGRWLLSPAWQADFTYHRFDINNGYDAFSLDLNRTTLADTPGEDALDSHAGRVLFTYSGHSAYTMELSASVLNADSVYSFDEDWAFEGIRPGWEYNSFDEYVRDRSQTEIEARFLSNQPIQLFGIESSWLAGVYHQRREQQLTRNYTYLSMPFGSRYETENQAVYAELGMSLTSRLRGNLGVRFEQYSNDYIDSRGIEATPQKSNWGGRMSLEYAMSEQGSAFVNWARGFKAGGVNGEALGRMEDENLDEFRDFLEQRAVFSPEFLSAFEVGYRHYSAQHSLAFEIVGFYSWRDDMQVNAYVEREATFVTYLDNASSGTNYGVESRFDYTPSDQLRVFMSFGLLRTEYRDLMLQDGTNLTGREQAHAPQYQAFAGFEWMFSSALQFRAEVDARDAFYYSNSHDERSEPYQLVHLRLNYEWRDWQFSVFARNVFDQDYTTRGFYFGNDPRDDYAAKNYVQYGEPRRLGVSARYRF